MSQAIVRMMIVGVIGTFVVLAMMSPQSLRTSTAESGVPAWAKDMPTEFPWPLTHTITEGGGPIELAKPVRTRAELLDSVPSGTRQDGYSLQSITCWYGSNWNLISTFVAEFGTVFACSAPVPKTAGERFGYVDPVFNEFIQTDSYGPHLNIAAFWIHTKYTSIDPADLVWCTNGSGTIYFQPQQFWISSGCNLY